MKILTLENLPEILSFEKERMASMPGDDFEKEMAAWKARWRRESLEHYLPLGWSFGIWSEKGQLVGYLLGQPLLFFQGFTQCLWVEHMSYSSHEIGEKLVEIAYRWSKDKHLQRVLFSEQEEAGEIFKKWPSHLSKEDVRIIKTAKYE